MWLSADLQFISDSLSGSVKAFAFMRAKSKSTGGKVYAF
jgi:hypothetical protein